MESNQLSTRLKELMLLLFDFSEIERHIFFPDGKKKDRKENDVEHSYSLAMCAWYLSQYFPQLHQPTLIKMALAHDLVEVHAGDVMAIGRTEEEEKRKVEQEKIALEKLKNDWSDFPELTDTIMSYEEKSSPEARFVSALDKLLPLYLNLLSEGKTWRHYHMSRSEVIRNKDEKTKGSAEISKIWQEIRKEMLEHDEFFSTLP